MIGVVSLFGLFEEENVVWKLGWATALSLPLFSRTSVPISLMLVSNKKSVWKIESPQLALSCSLDEFFMPTVEKFTSEKLVWKLWDKSWGIRRVGMSPGSILLRNRTESAPEKIREDGSSPVNPLPAPMTNPWGTSWKFDSTGMYYIRQRVCLRQITQQILFIFACSRKIVTCSVW